MRFVKSVQRLGFSLDEIAELLAGIEAMPQGRRRDALKLALKGQMMPLFEGRILPFDNKAAEAFAQISTSAAAKGNPISFADCAIASIARAHGFMVATRNGRDFRETGVEIFNPWAGDAVQTER